MKSQIRSKLRLFVNKRFPQTRKFALDVTGNEVSASSLHTRVDLDFCIMMTISAEDDATALLRQVISRDADCGLAYSLLALQHLRSKNLTHSKEEFEGCLKHLNRLAYHGILSTREKFLSAGTIKWAQGHYRKAAALFETSLVNTENDALLLRLAQDCYLLAGDTRNALGCITRNLQVFSDNHHLHGYYQGMLATGYLYREKWIDAEETGQRSLNITKGRDAYGLHALFSTYQLLGRSSEVLAVCDQYQQLNNEGQSQQLMHFHSAWANIQRGNYSGARSFLRELEVDLLPSSHRSVTSVTSASILLWHLYLNDDSAAIDEKLSTSIASLWTPFIELNDTDEGLGFTTAWQDIAVLMSLLISVKLRKLRNETTSQTQATNETVTVAPEKSIRNQKPQSRTWETWITSSVSGLVQGTEVSRLPPHPQEFVEPELLLESHLERMKRLANRASKDFSDSNSSRYSYDFNQLAPSVLDLQPTFRLSNASSHPLIGLDWSNRDRQSLLALAIGSSLVHMVEGRYAKAADELMPLRQTFRSLGGNVAETDILDLSLAECLLRSGNMVEARMMFSERTALAPNEAQSWRRLSRIFKELGLSNASESAQYTSWQLGIGQGGFGGLR